MPSAAGVYLGRVVTVDAGRHMVDIMPEMEPGQVWTDVPYQPLVDRVEGEWHDPDVGSAVVVLQDALGRRRVIGPPETFVEWHLVSAVARVRVDLKRNTFTVIVDGGVSVSIEGTEVQVRDASKVQINGGSHPAVRGDLLKTWWATVEAWGDAHTHTGPVGPPAVASPAFDDEILNPTVFLD
jgi:hypothetical protein